MESRPHLRPGRLALAVTLSTALVLSAPFIGFVRAWIRTTFPGQFVRIIGSAIGVLAVVAVVAAALRIRTHRLVRYGAIATALVFAVWYSLAEATGNPDVDVVQRFHFVEYGVITFLFYRAWRPLEDPAILVLPVLAGLLVGTADEWLQWFIPNRVGEIADVLLNGIAIGCGMLFSLGADPPTSFLRRMRPGSVFRIGRLGAATILTIAVFVQIVHLGYDVRDDEAGTFKSRWSKSELERLGTAKRDEWRTQPPPLVLQRVSREDQYLTEGVTHVQKRNELLGAHDSRSAWIENLILEKYFTPVLDTPSYWSRTGHRWSAEQRQSVQMLAAGGDPGYVSRANPYPIYTWSRTLFWLVAIALAAIVWIVARVVDRSGRPG
jgi:VanZ like family